ncbi:MAG TPA: ChbG/HpnK family deacetylase [Terracidiphilus sp.]|nr:ChbG/HpnK family deacetylase [Terracidiphilus sp.]
MGALIINADDFGLTSSVNRAIIELHTAGVVTSTSLMARAGATDDAIALALRTPTLGVGCHVVLVDGEPVLPPEQIPTLIDLRTGHFPASLATFLRRLFSGRIRIAEVEAEISAQIALLQQRGLRLTHVDTHKHTHVFSQILRPLLRAAHAAGIRAVRNPFEPHWSTRATRRAHWMRLAQVGALRWLEPESQRIIREAGFVTTSGTVAVAGTGILDAATLRSLLRALPNGNWELVTHPGYHDADLDRVNTRLRATRDVEREALAVIKEFPAIQLISFADLARF